MTTGDQTFAAGPTLSAGYGEAIATLRSTWRAGVISSLLTALGAVLLTAFLLIAALAVSVASASLVPPSRASLLYLLLAMSASVLTYLVIAFCAITAYAVLLAPGLQAMYRAHARYLRDDVQLTFNDGVRGSMTSWSLNGFLVVAALLEMVGYLCLFVPGVLVSAALAMVAPAMVVHGLTLPAALRRSLGHFFEAPLWHITLALADAVVVFAVGSALPVVGPLITMPLSVQLHLRAYGVAFGQPSRNRAP